jgi:hypothetical protein
MGFRQPKSDAHRRDRAWHNWIGEHRAELAAIGLPPEVYLDEAHWHDFLQNGHLHWHPGAGFSFDTLSLEQMQSLSHFLEREYDALSTEERASQAPLIGWICVRLDSRPS